jgi:2-methylcitrate dehydratase PrpD
MLQQTAALLSAMSLRPRPLFAADAAVSDITMRLSSYMADAAKSPLPAEVVEKTKQHIADTIAAMVSGINLKPAQTALKFAGAHRGEGVATIAASNLLCGPVEAAMVNGMLAHSDETDDSHAPSHSHPGCATIPAALACGELFKVDGERFIRAVALGYDIGTRMNLTMGGLPYQMESHRSMHSMGSNFAAAAASGSIAGFDAHQMRWLLDYTAQQVGGIAAWERDTEHVEKSLVFGGFPARNAVSTTLLLQQGATGVEDILSGPDNFLMAFGPKGSSSTLVDQLGARFEVTRTNIKKWTVGSPIQAPLDAIVNLRKRRPFEAADVRDVTVRIATSEANTVNNREIPDICLQHMVAIMLIDKTATFLSAHDMKRMNDAKVQAERAKIHLIPDADLEKLYPKRITVVELTLNDGTQLTERVEAVRGTAENPMTHDEVVAKCLELCGPVLGRQQSEALVSKLMNLEAVANVLQLRPLLQKH